MKKSNESNFVTEIKLGEILETSGPAKFKILEFGSSGHKNRARVSVIADRSTQISKRVETAIEQVKKWGL